MFGLFNRKPKCEVYFHEDDYCQTEILPMENWQFCSIQVDEIADFAIENSDGEAGFKDVYLRSDEEYSLSNRNIQKSEFLKHFSSFQTDHFVSTGYSTYRESAANTVAITFSKFDHLFFEFNPQNSVIEKIWLIENVKLTEEETQQKDVALLSVGKKYNLLCVDWAYGFLFNLSDPTGLDRFKNRYEE